MGGPLNLLSFTVPYDPSALKTPWLLKSSPGSTGFLVPLRSCFFFPKGLEQWRQEQPREGARFSTLICDSSFLSCLCRMVEAARAGALATILLGSTKAGLWVSLSRSLVEDTEPPVKRLTAALRRVMFSSVLKMQWVPLSVIKTERKTGVCLPCLGSSAPAHRARNPMHFSGYPPVLT